MSTNAGENGDGKSDRTRARLLPWSREDGKPCYLSSGDGTGALSRLADGMESVQLGMGREVLAQARVMLSVERDGRHMGTLELRWLASRLAESLSDALRISESRGLRLPVAEPEEREEVTP